MIEIFINVIFLAIHGGSKKMMYCNRCAKKEGWPIMMLDSLKSFGPCECCGQQRLCNDIKSDMLELGGVELFPVKQELFLKSGVKNSLMKATRGKYRVLGFNLKKSFGNGLVVAVSVLDEQYDSWKCAGKRVLQLRKQTKKKDLVYFLYDSKGLLTKIKKD